MSRLTRIVIVLIASMAISACGGSSPSAPSALSTPTPTPTGVSLTSIYSKVLSRDLVSGDIISIPDTLTVRGTYHVADPQPGARYGVFSVLKLDSSKAVPKFSSSNLPSPQEGVWVTAYEITGPPSISENGGPRQYYDTTDVVQMAISDGSGGVSLFFSTASFVIRYKTSP